MSYNSQIIGKITYNYTTESAMHIIGEFVNNRKLLDQHLTRTIGHKASFSLPDSIVNNTSINFKDNTGEYLNVKESLQVIISFLKSIEITNIKIDLIQHGKEYDDIVHYIYKDNNIMFAKAVLVFEDYND